MKVTDLAVKYVTSPQWQKLSRSSQRIYMSGMAGLDEFGLLKMDVKEVERPTVIAYRDYMYDRPGMCRNGLTILSNILGYGYDRGFVDYNHAKGIGGLPEKRSIPRWSNEEVELFLATAPEYLADAFILTLYTGQRRSDVSRMKWTDYDGRTIKIMQEKTGKKMRIPVHKALRKVLNRLQSKPVITLRRSSTSKVVSPFIIHNCFGQPWVNDSLSSAIAKHARKVGIYGRSIHGLRKTAAATLAEIGCSPHEIAAITGQSLKEVEHYTQEADQLRMANRAVKRWEKEKDNEGRRDTA